jgi:predicted nucleic acid-binding protein
LIVVDTGPLVALADIDDEHHARCVEWFRTVRVPLVVPALVVTEVCQLLESPRGAKPGSRGSKAEAGFIRGLANPKEPFLLAPTTNDELLRIAQLVEKYHDLPLGAADASVVALAERLRLDVVATIDRKHFGIVRPNHVASFTLVP